MCVVPTVNCILSFLCTWSNLYFLESPEWGVAKWSQFQQEMKILAPCCSWTFVNNKVFGHNWFHQNGPKLESKFEIEIFQHKEENNPWPIDRGGIVSKVTWSQQGGFENSDYLRGLYVYRKIRNYVFFSYSSSYCEHDRGSLFVQQVYIHNIQNKTRHAEIYLTPQFMFNNNDFLVLQQRQN